MRGLLNLPIEQFRCEFLTFNNSKFYVGTKDLTIGLVRISWTNSPSAIFNKNKTF
jgi:hypothetical protein